MSDDEKTLEGKVKMIEREDVVAAVIGASEERSIVGRMRLQRIVYILDRLGLNSGFTFDDQHFGPYSRDLENATADAKAFDLIEEDVGRRRTDGAVYGIFKLKGEPKKDAHGGLGPARTRDLVRKCIAANATVLELAATADWLLHTQKHADWKTELVKRKRLKAADGRMEKAVGLWTEIGLAPCGA